MKRTTESSNNKKLFLLLLTIFCLATIFSLRQVINDQFIMMDHIWNYSFAAKISVDYIPYHDFHLLQTPLSFYITACFFKIFGNYYHVYAIMGAIFIALMYYLVYQVAHKITNSHTSSMYVFLITSIYTALNYLIYNYNTLSVIFVLIVLLFELDDRKNIKNNIYIGFILGLLFLTKQNICAGIVLVSYSFLLFSSGLSIKEKVKIIALRSLIAALPVLAYVVYLYSNNALYDFIDHTVLGVFDFSETNPFRFPWIQIVFVVLPALIFGKVVSIFVKQKRFQFNDPLLGVFSYVTGMLFILYPLCDLNHLSIAFVLVFLLLPFVYSSGKMTFLPVTRGILIAFLPVTFLYNIIFPWTGDFIFFSESPYYRYTIVDKAQVEPIKLTLDYLEKKKQEGIQVVFLDTRAMAYRSMVGIYDDPFDFLVSGNMGYQGETKALSKIKELKEGSLFMIGETTRMQEMILLRSYAMCHYENVDKVSMYDVYRKPANVKEDPVCVDDLVKKYAGMLNG